MDPDCAVNTENHLEKEILAVFRRLRNPPIGSVLTFGGLYGGVHGEGVDVPDDPAVELMLELQQRGNVRLKGLCMFCDEEQVRSLTRAQGLQSALRTLNIPDPLRWADLQLPAEFAGLAPGLARRSAPPAGGPLGAQSGESQPASMASLLLLCSLLQFGLPGAATFPVLSARRSGVQLPSGSDVMLSVWSDRGSGQA